MFFIVMLAFYFGGYTYIIWRVNSGLAIAAPYNHYLLFAALLVALISLLTTFFSRKGMLAISVLGPLGFIIMGCFAVTVTVFILNDIVNISNLFLKIKSFRYYSTLASLTLSTILCAWALLSVAFIQNIKEITIKVPNLPVDSIKIVQIADLHINSFTSPKVISKIIDRIQGLNPDMIVLVGDILDTDINKDDKFLEYGFGKLKSPLGVFAVTGNHEYYTGVKVFYDMFDKLGVKVLKDENLLVNKIINVAGINDTNWNNPDKIAQSLQKLDPNYPTLFLSHRPESFDIAAKQADIVQLSGHTHAGQIPPIWIARKFFMKYNYGFYNIGKSILYITSGVRWWGPPMRLFNTSEIVLITLVKG